MNARLPAGFVVALGHRTRVRDSGRTLIGGSPTRVLYLSARARQMLVDGRLTVTDAATAALADRLLETGIADPVVSELPELERATVSYVIPVKDRPTALDRVLASIGGGDRVIVVDDCSDDPTQTAVIAAKHGARVVALPVNVGPGQARNEGLRLVTTDFVVFVDSDVVLNPMTVEIMLRHFADPRVALVAPRVIGLATGTGPTWINRYEDARSSLDLGLHPGIVRPRALVSWVSGTTLLGRVSSLGAGFSPLHSGEDVDLVWRLAEEGYRVRYEPAATVLHEHRASVQAWMSRKAHYGSSAAELARRHPGNVAPAVIAPWGVAFVLALVAQRRWSLPAALAIAIVTALRISRRLGSSDRPAVTAAELTANGMLAAVAQAMALLLRHWWPAVAVGLPFSRRLRRAVVTAHLVDATLEQMRTRARMDPFRFALARRLDDLAYGAGVWLSVIRARSVKALLPDFKKQRSH